VRQFQRLKVRTCVEWNSNEWRVLTGFPSPPFSKARSSPRLNATELNCPVHRAEMVDATHWIRVDGQLFPKAVRSCIESRCLWVYAQHGFYKVLNETIGSMRSCATQE
jgi:hypothetical protein